MFKCAILTISDRCSQGSYEDLSGPAIKEIIPAINGEVIISEVVPDEPELIKEKLKKYADESKLDLVITTGGTGFGPRDLTPEATKDIADRLVPGISEFMRSEGAKKTKKAVLSRGVSVLRSKTLIINLPGSPKAVKESLTAIIDLIPHALEMIKGKGH